MPMLQMPGVDSIEAAITCELLEFALDVII